MRFLAVLALQAIAAYCSEEEPTIPSLQRLRIIYQFEKTTQQASVEVWDVHQTHMICRVCKPSIQSHGLEGNPLTFDVDESGAGNVTIGGQTFRIHEDPNISGGIECGRITSSVAALVACDVHIPRTTPLAHVEKRDFPECFANGRMDLSQDYFSDISTDSDKSSMTTAWLPGLPDYREYPRLNDFGT